MDRYILNFKNFKNKIVEGIDIDNKNKKVSFNNDHQNNVNTCYNYNPTISKLEIDGKYIDIISIFKRVENIENSDGNPLIYTLKGLKDWEFNSKEDYKNLLNNFNKIVNKIEKDYDTIISVPSNNKLNNIILKKVKNLLNIKNSIPNLLSKYSASYIYKNFLDIKSMKNDHKNDINKILLLISKVQKMIDDGDKFSFKDIIPKYRKYIKKSIHISNDNDIIKYKDLINDKNIIIIDDTISSGSSLKHAYKEVLDTFTPNKVTIITLFSPL